MMILLQFLVHKALAHWLPGIKVTPFLYDFSQAYVIQQRKKKIEKTDLWSDPERYIYLFFKFCTSALPAGNKSPAVALPTSNSLQ